MDLVVRLAQFNSSNVRNTENLKKFSIIIVGKMILTVNSKFFVDLWDWVSDFFLFQLLR